MLCDMWISSQLQISGKLYNTVYNKMCNSQMCNSQNLTKVHFALKVIYAKHWKYAFHMRVKNCIIKNLIWFTLNMGEFGMHNFQLNKIN